MRHRIPLLTFLALAAGIVFVTLCPVDLRPQTGHPVLERFAAFAALGAAGGLAFPRRPLQLLGFLVLFAALLEAAQLIAPTRDAHVLDALEKIAGAASGLAGALAASRIWRPGAVSESSDPTGSKLGTP